MSFFDIDETSRLDRVAQLVAKDPSGVMQSTQVSPHASGPVGAQELLARSLEYPNKFDASGGLNDSFFADAFKFGASAQRLLNGWDVHATDVHQRFEARAATRRRGDAIRKAAPDNLYVGSFHMTAAELRTFQIESETRQRVRVYDAALVETDPLHAEILADGSDLKKHLKHEMRVRLMALAELRGLYVSPFLSEAGLSRARNIGCNLNYPHPPPPPQPSALAA